MIIDTHAHLGHDDVFDEKFTVEELVETQNRARIDVTIVQPALTHTLDRVQRMHDNIADLAAKRPGRFFGMANPNPHLDPDHYERELVRCIVDLHFVGVKIHPFAHAVNPAGVAAMNVFRLAHEHRIPVMVHTGVGIPWSAPALLEPAAMRFPDVCIVLAHAGGIFSAEAAMLARRLANIYLETSWQAGFVLGGLCREGLANRIMFGSDHADNAAAEIAKIRGSMAPQVLDAVFAATAQSVYRSITNITKEPS